MQLSPDLRDQVADGAITVSFRLLSIPRVKVGGICRTASVWIEIDEIDLVPFSSITPEDVELTGESGLRALCRRAEHAGDIHDNTVVYRVEFHVMTRPDEAHR